MTKKKSNWVKKIKKNSKPKRCPLFFLKKKIEVKERLKGRDKRRTRKIIVTKLGDNVTNRAKLLKQAK